jgi:hypothetical protein
MRTLYTGDKLGKDEYITAFDLDGNQVETTKNSYGVDQLNGKFEQCSRTNDLALILN